MLETITVSDVLRTNPKRIYQAWLNSKEHSAFTGSEAKVDPKIGGSFTAWDGYIQGKTIELEPYDRITQSWRTTDFPKKADDSMIEVILEEIEEGTKITIQHTDIPEGQGEQYKQGWIDFYFTPMKGYFGKKIN